MNILFNYLNNLSNYSIHNNNNIFNFLFVIMLGLDNTSRVKFVENMKLLIGISFYEKFKFYIFRKAPTTELLNFFN